MNNVMQKFRSSLVLGVGLLLLGCGLRSQAALAVFNFNSSNRTSTDTDANSTASAITATGLTTSYADPNFATGDTRAIRATAASMSSTLGADYFRFTVTATSGSVLNMSTGGGLTFQFARSTGFSPNQFNWAVRSSLDNYGANLASGATAGSSAWAPATVALGTTFDNQAAITFRIYVWDGTASGTTKYGYLDNITLGGVSAVPEPANVALAIFGLGAAGAGAGRRLYKRRNRAHLPFLHGVG